MQFQGIGVSLADVDPKKVETTIPICKSGDLPLIGMENENVGPQIDNVTVNIPSRRMSQAGGSHSALKSI